MTAPPPRPHIVFVDDDLNLLNGLRRCLLGQRGEWEMSFCPSGAAALTLMANRPADVVISDMRMPEMDGAALFSKIATLCPRAVRIILSG
ncbi:MAG: response regulator [Rhodospirillaceae bacterium]